MLNGLEIPADQMNHLDIKDTMDYIPEEELLCDFVHPTMFKKQGVMINFINHNCPDSATIIGGIRMKTTEIIRVPALLARHYTSLKMQASHFLQKHLLRCQNALGCNEPITVDDFSLSFMVASLSPAGFKLHPSGRNEGPLHFCLYSGLVEMVNLGYADDGTPMGCYVINAYVHLMEPTRRRTTVLKKAAEDKKRTEAKASQSQGDGYYPAAKKQKFVPKKPLMPGAPTQEFNELKQSISRIERNVKQLNLPTPKYPDLPERPDIKWPPTEAGPQMPEDL